ncbi:MAG: hypothetical protein HC827_12600 [Cyanobacteria bacterium RM1_2_2]|nr:hypothetical protein [Cyanobacteria bacterium RM1_2_2]
MQINASIFLPFPRPLVYATYRDKLLELAAHMPNVKSVQLKSRQAQASTVQQVYEWHGKSDIPAMLKAFVSEDLLTWTDHATWKEADFVTDWTIQPHAFSEAITWAGQDRYLEAGSGTRVESKGILAIDPKHLKGVPGFLSGQVSRIAEDILAKQAEPNFIEMSQCVEKYLQQHAS